MCQGAALELDFEGRRGIGWMVIRETVSLAERLANWGLQWPGGLLLLLGAGRSWGQEGIQGVLPQAESWRPVSTSETSSGGRVGESVGGVRSPRVLGRGELSRVWGDGAPWTAGGGPTSSAPSNPP